MEHLISMYAALQKYKVTVSYPDGQMHANDFNYGHGYDQDFVTLYTFGPYQLEHTDVARKQQFLKGYKEKLVFTKPGTTLSIPVIVNNRLVGLDKDYVALSKAIRAKSEGKKFENPFEKTINDSIYELQFYLTELSGTHDKTMPYGEIQKTISQLDEMKKRLLLTQNINYSDQK